MTSDDKKYQVFVSSTYEDLIPERQEIMHALLELDAIPSGMELFPAANEDQWSLIKGVIDDCDYYVVVLAGRYGSVGSDGMSYTEREYRYALERGKPVIAFLHKDPGALPSKHTEKTEEGRARLEAFRQLVQQKMCKTWDTKEALGSVVSRSLIKLQKNHPGVGWVRGDRLPSEDSVRELLRLRKRVDELQAELLETRTEAPEGTERLAQGDDLFEIGCRFPSTGPDNDHHSWTWSVGISWNDLFAEVSPLLIHEASSRTIFSRLNDMAKARINQAVSKDKKFRGHSHIWPIEINRTDIETVLIQLNALGLIAQSVRTRSVRDSGDYWRLTPYGATVMNRLRAVSKP